ncbi:MAG: GIY-YIG nuclease family protein [Patescibacteria group bacterium]|nr:GIY-YIG nuclease family protein [Patescibacteria group bacterium]
MYYVYIIQSIRFPNRFYTGFSENIANRLTYHDTGLSPHTSKYRPWKLLCCVSFTDKKKALNFEKYLKTASGIAFRNKRLI